MGHRDLSFLKALVTTRGVACSGVLRKPLFTVRAMVDLPENDPASYYSLYACLATFCHGQAATGPKARPREGAQAGRSGQAEPRDHSESLGSPQ